MPEHVSPALWVAGACSGVPNLGNLPLELQHNCSGYPLWEQIRASTAQLLWGTRIIPQHGIMPDLAGLGNIERII